MNAPAEKQTPVREGDPNGGTVLSETPLFRSVPPLGGSVNREGLR